MFDRCLLAALALACAGCASTAPSERLAIPVVEKSTHLDAKTLIAVVPAYKPKVAAREPEPAPAPAAVFIPEPSKTFEQKVTFVSDSDEWAKQQKSKLKIKKPQKELITDADLDNKIKELKVEYEKGDVEAAYQLVGLYLKRQRVEEAEMALDYAARQYHVPSMMLYGRYFQKIGDKGMAKKWFQAAADAGSQEAKSELKTI
jgi:TPR repeat protein